MYKKTVQKKLYKKMYKKTATKTFLETWRSPLPRLAGALPPTAQTWNFIYLLIYQYILIHVSFRKDNAR